VAFRTENAARQGDYYDGLASTMQATCRAADDISRQLGDPQEASTRQALDYLAGRTCTPISYRLSTQSAQGRTRHESCWFRSSPSTAQREAPGTF
jgi:hypothetical protein